MVVEDLFQEQENWTYNALRINSCSNTNSDLSTFNTSIYVEIFDQNFTKKQRGKKKIFLNIF